MTAVDEAFAALAECLRESAQVLPAQLERAAQLLGSVLDAGGTVFAVGNGGSAADAQHLTSELIGRFVEDRSPWRAVALSVDPSAVTAISNDYGFEEVFARQIEALARPGDVLVVFSTSGSSPNILAGARAARAAGCAVIAFTGSDTAAVADLVDVCIAVPSMSVPRIQEVHGLCLHAVVARLEERATAGQVR